MARPAEALSKILDKLFNPMALLRDDITGKERARFLLEALPLKITAEQIAEKTGRPAARYVDMAKKHALVAIDEALSVTEDERRVAHVAKLDKERTVEQLRDVLKDAVIAFDWGEKVEKLAGELSTVDVQIQANQRQADSLEREQFADADAAFTGRKNEIANDANRRIDEIKLQAMKDIRLAEIARDERKAAATAEKIAKLQQFQEDLAARRETLAAKLAAARAYAEDAARIKATRGLLTQHELEADEKEREWRALDASVKGLRELATWLQGQIPIKGLEIRGGELFANGVPFEELNTEQQISYAVEIAMQRAGPLGLVIVDGIERLDPQRRQYFRELAKNSGLQFIVTEVTEGPLEVVAA